MKLLTQAIKAQLIDNDIHRRDDDHDPRPVVKFFNPCGGATWLITEYDQTHRFFYGLCDLGFGCPELGTLSRDELEAYRGQLGIGIERDLYWTADKTLSEYATAAREAGHIVA